MNFIYAPNSIYHGRPVWTNSASDRLKVLTIEHERLVDFVEFLFDHSEHCDHISHRDAWKEFEIYEQKNSLLADRIRKERAKRRI